MTDLSTKLKDALKTKDVTAAQAVRATGIPAQTIYGWLSGVCPRDLPSFFKFCDYLGLSLDEMFGKTKKPTVPLPSNNFLPTGNSDYSGTYEVSVRRISPK